MCVEQRRGEMIFLFYYFLLRMTLTVLNQRLTLLTGIEMKYKSDFKSQFSNMMNLKVDHLYIRISRI